MSSFTPVASLVGGVMLSLSTSSLLGMYGNVFGVSGISHSVVSDPLKPTARGSKAAALQPWRVACVAGLVAGGALLRVFHTPIAAFAGAPVLDEIVSGPVGGRMLVAGFLVGAGTKISNGCTSGFMLCGLARLSKRALVATATFFGVALATAQRFPAHLPALPPTTTSNYSLATFLLLQLPLPLYIAAPYFLPKKAAKPVATFFMGVHFAFGLALAGMTRPSKVLSFFYVPLSFLPLHDGRKWDPSLAMVAIGGLLPNMAFWQYVKRWDKPAWAENWSLPTRKDVDLRLVVGSALFGVGWGLSGLCPGPAVTVAGAMHQGIPAFALAFASGGALVNLLLG